MRRSNRRILRVIPRAPLMGLYLSVFASGENTKTSVPVGFWNISARPKSSKLLAAVGDVVGEHGSVAGGFDAANNRRSISTTSSMTDGRSPTKPFKCSNRVAVLHF